MAASRTFSRSFTCPSIPLILNPSHRKFSAKMALNTITTTTMNNNSSRSRRKLPILLFDVMDTLVRDPFYQDVPAFFSQSLPRNTSKMGGLKNCMKSGYFYIEGVEELLRALKKHGYEMHTFTNYPIWYKMIEDKLKLSTYLSWTFCSCISGKRKPDAEFYLEVLNYLKVDPPSCIFIDDRMKNVEAAIEAGFIGIQFKNVDLLRKELSIHGINISENENNEN